MLYSFMPLFMRLCVYAFMRFCLTPIRDYCQQIVDVDDPIVIDVSGAVRRLRAPAPSRDDRQQVIDVDEAVAVDVGRSQDLQGRRVAEGKAAGVVDDDIVLPAVIEADSIG